MLKKINNRRHNLPVESVPNKSQYTSLSDTITQHWYSRGCTTLKSMHRCSYHDNGCKSSTNTWTDIYNLSQAGVISRCNLLKHLLNGIARPIKYRSVYRSARGWKWVGFWSSRGHAPRGWAWPTAMRGSGSKRSIVRKKRMCEQCTQLLVSNPAPIVRTCHCHCTIVVMHVKNRGWVCDYSTTIR